MKRGEVWVCALDPTVGSEIRKTRPCLIVSPDALNQRLQTIVVAPMTSGGRAAPFRVPVMFGGVTGLILPDQMRALDRRRLRKRIGAIEDAELVAALEVLQQMFQT